MQQKNVWAVGCYQCDSCAFMFLVSTETRLITFGNWRFHQISTWRNWFYWLYCLFFLVPIIINRNKCTLEKLTTFSRNYCYFCFKFITVRVILWILSYNCCTFLLLARCAFRGLVHWFLNSPRTVVCADSETLRSKMWEEILTKGLKLHWGREGTDGPLIDGQNA